MTTARRSVRASEARRVYVRTADFLVAPAQLREWRVAAKLRQVDAAIFFGVSERTWRRWERGDTAPAPAVARALRATLAPAASRGDSS